MRVLAVLFYHSPPLQSLSSFICCLEIKTSNNPKILFAASECLAFLFAFFVFLFLVCLFVFLDAVSYDLAKISFRSDSIFLL